MFRHVIMFRWKDEATEEQKQAVRDCLAALPRDIPEIRSWQFGDDVRLYPESFHFVLIADFDDVTAYTRYRDHPIHLRMIEEHVNPILVQYIRTQYEWSEETNQKN